MKFEDFEKCGKLNNLIPCRKIALDDGNDIKIVLNSKRYWDLMSLYRGDWHYITTIKI